MLVVGQTCCGKNSFVQKLGKNKNFSYASVEFHYPNDVGEFETILELLKDNKSDVNINISNTEADDLGIGEKYIFGWLIVMDDVSGLADKSNEFYSFLTVSRKYRYSCIYIFQINFPQLRNWQMIISQTKNFNIFPSTVQIGNLSKLLTNNCNRETLKYIPTRELWNNRHYFEIANRKDYSCLTIVKAVPQNTEQQLTISCDKLVFLVKRKKIGCLTGLLRII